MIRLDPRGIHRWDRDALLSDAPEVVQNPSLRSVDWSGSRAFVSGPGLGLVELGEGAVVRRVPQNVLAMRFLGSGHGIGSGVTRGRFHIVDPRFEAVPIPFLAQVAFRRPSVTVSAARDRALMLSRHSSGELVEALDGEPPTVRPLPDWPGCLMAAPAGTRILCVDAQGAVRRREREATDPSGVLFVVPGTSALAVSSDGETVALGTLDGALEVWRLSPPERLLRGRAHDRRVAAVAFSPDGTQAVTGSWDHTFRFWDLAVLDAETSALRSGADARWSSLPLTDRERRSGLLATP